MPFVYTMSIRELKAELPPPSHIYKNQEEAHDALWVELGWWLRQTKGTPDFPSAAFLTKTAKLLWTEIYTHLAPKR